MGFHNINLSVVRYRSIFMNRRSIIKSFRELSSGESEQDEGVIDPFL